jgi:hypothetical protein
VTSETPNPDPQRSAAREAAEEPEPDWAEQIRRLRKERGARLAERLAEPGAEPPVEGSSP